MLEGEVSSATMQQSLLVRDLEVTKESYEALKIAYNNLETESYPLAKHDKEIAEKNKLIEKAKAECSITNNSEIDRLQQMIADLNERLITSDTENIKIRQTAMDAQEELESYKKLSDKLKAKIRELSNKTIDKQDFMDTFEEVMKEEMMTMKEAFEAKLRNAREEAEANSKRYQQELNRIQSKKSFSTLPKL